MIANGDDLYGSRGGASAQGPRNGRSKCLLVEPDVLHAPIVDYAVDHVEADVLAGPLLAEEARAKGTVYSLAYGDQPALTCEIVDWARACGFEVVAAGKGTKYLPAYHSVTPDTAWPGLSAGADMGTVPPAILLQRSQVAGAYRGSVCCARL
jgi:hypothetical protein